MFKGIGSMPKLVCKLRFLDRAININIVLLKTHVSYWEPDHMLNIFYIVLTGGTCLEDVERLRNDETYMIAPTFRSVWFRGDTDFSLTHNFHGRSERVGFVFGYDAKSNLVGIADALTESSWKPLEQPARYEVKTKNGNLGKR